jgi:hypothetical protein
VVALVFDFVIVLIGRILMPWNRAASRRTVRRVSRSTAEVTA